MSGAAMLLMTLRQQKHENKRSISFGDVPRRSKMAQMANTENRISFSLLSCMDILEEFSVE
jgi:hypothetical protein